MELKVWVEGIQRIVCGVNEKTTCQDVVYALAHATGKTGRFTLIERWRNSERLLAPNEQPLKVLLKWGEHSNDVQFILHWAPLESASSKTAAGAKLLDVESVKNPSLVNASGTLGKSGSSRTRTTDVQQNNLMKRKESSNSASAVQTVTSRTSEGGGGLTESENSSNVDDATASANRTLTNYSHDNTDSDGSPSKPLKDLRISSPPPYREPPNPGTTRGPVSANQTKGLPPYREPPPPNLNSHNSAVRFSSSASLQNQKQSTASVNNVNPVLPNSIGETKSNMQEPSTIGKHIGGICEPLTNSSDQRSIQISKEYSSTNGADVTSANGILPKKTVAPISTANPQYHELVRLINVQRDKLTTQHAELTQYDAEILYWEGKAKEQQRHLEFIMKEISRLELYSAQQESQVLSLMHLEQENDIVAQESESLQSEIDRLRKEYEKCEKDVANCRSKVGHLTQELQMQRSNVKQRQDEWKKRESATLAEIDILKQELELARRETEAVTDLSGNLDREVSSLEADLAGKKKQMERLLNAMKEANLQSLTIQSPDELVDQSSHHRSGSTRKMIGSPRQLENAAPTSKNPHGVWV